jgi:hypothetical protein
MERKQLCQQYNKDIVITHISPCQIHFLRALHKDVPNTCVTNPTHKHSSFHDRTFHQYENMYLFTYSMEQNPS